MGDMARDRRQQTTWELLPFCCASAALMGLEDVTGAAGRAPKRARPRRWRITAGPVARFRDRWSDR